MDEGPRAQKMNAKDKIRRNILKHLGEIGTVAEIGVWRGRFTEILLEMLAPRKLYLIDPWRPTDGGGYGDVALTADKDAAEMDKVLAFVENRFAAQIASGQVEIRRGFSGEVLPTFPDDSLDMIYIDGDHRFDGVMADLHLAYRKVRPGGFIVLDDYHQRGWWGDDVQRAVHHFIAQHITDIRIHVVIGAQVALEKQAPAQDPGVRPPPAP